MAVRAAVDSATVRSVFIVGPDKKVKAMLIYPMSAGRNFDEVLRLLDSLQLNANPAVAAVNWRPGRRDHPDIGLRRGCEEEMPRRFQNPEAVSAHRGATEVTASAERSPRSRSSG